LLLLTLAQAKELLLQTQRSVAAQQIAEYQRQQAACSHCNKKLCHKDQRTIVYRTPFGKLQLQSQRLFHCACIEQPTRTFNPVANLLKERTSPELLYLESKFASLMSYGLSTELLQELLPIEGAINAASIRNNLHALGQRLESELPAICRNIIRGLSKRLGEAPQTRFTLGSGYGWRICSFL
jgi:hypothetical protein